MHERMAVFTFNFAPIKEGSFIMQSEVGKCVCLCKCFLCAVSKILLHLFPGSAR